MKEFGYKKVELWLDKAELDVIVHAAARAGKRLATYIRVMAFQAAAQGLGIRPALIARAQLDHDLPDVD